jgi:hypothetical protein
MTETPTSPDTGQPPSPDIPRPADRRAGSRRTLNFLSFVIVLLLIVLGLLFWQWSSTRHRLNALEQALTQRLEQFDEVNRQSSAMAGLAERRSAEAALRAEQLEQQLAQ